MTTDRLVTVSRTVAIGAGTITETAWAELPDDLVLDAVTEARRRSVLAALLFQSLPSIQSLQSHASCPPTPPPPPLNSRN